MNEKENQAYNVLEAIETLRYEMTRQGYPLVRDTDVAEKIGVTKTTLSRWRSGRTKISYRNLVRIKDLINQER